MPRSLALRTCEALALLQLLSSNNLSRLATRLDDAGKKSLIDLVSGLLLLLLLVAALTRACYLESLHFSNRTFLMPWLLPLQPSSPPLVPLMPWLPPLQPSSPPLVPLMLIIFFPSDPERPGHTQ